MDLILGGGGAVVVTMGFLYREGGIEGDNSQNALNWVPSMYYSFDHLPNASHSRVVKHSWTTTVKLCPTGTPEIQFANQFKRKSLLYPELLFQLTFIVLVQRKWLSLCIPT